MRNPKYFLRVYRAFMKVSILSNIQYRASGMIWMIGSILEPTIFLIVWSAVAKAEGGAVGGFTAQEFAGYYITLMLVNHLTFTWIMQVFQFRIQQGQLSYELLRPIHPIHGDITDNIAYKLVQMVVMIPAMITLIWLFDPVFNYTVQAIVVTLPILLLAFVIRFMLEWTLAMAAFWTTRTMAINQTYFAVMMFFSGRVAPIALMPVWIQTMAGVLPFYYVVAFPVEVLTGRITGVDIIDGVVWQVFWLICAATLLTLIWRRAVQNYSAVGG